MKTIKIKEAEYPFKVTLSALIEFEDKFDKSFTEMGAGMRVKEMVYLIYSGLKAGSELEGKEFTHDDKWLAQNLDLSNMNDYLELALKDISDNEKK